MGENSSNTYLRLQNPGSMTTRHTQGGTLMDVVGVLVGAAHTAKLRHHLGNASIDEWSPACDAAHLKTAAKSADVIASLRAQSEGPLADWCEAAPRGSDWIDDHLVPALDEWLAPKPA